MREIKFRAFINGKQEMADEVEQIDFGNEEVFLQHKVGYGAVTWDTFDMSEVGLIEYTGLKDKNGVEIYEGDILNIFIFDSKLHAEVELKNGVFGIYNDMFRYGYKSIYSLHQIISMYDIEVIGNIYKNPELLEVE